MVPEVCLRVLTPPAESGYRIQLDELYFTQVKYHCWRNPVNFPGRGGFRGDSMPMDERRAWEKDQRRNRIIAIAETVFHRRGYEATTLPVVAAAAGYNRRTLYLYFRDKEELFLAVALRALEALGEALRSASASGGGLRALAQAVFAFALERPNDLDVIMGYEGRHFEYRGHQDPTRREGKYQLSCQRASEAIMNTLTSAISEGMVNGRIHTALTPRQLMLILWGQIFGVLQVLRIRESHFEDAFGSDIRRLFDSFVDMVETSLSLSCRIPADKVVPPGSGPHEISKI